MTRRGKNIIENNSHIKYSQRTTPENPKQGKGEGKNITRTSSKRR